ncbi:MAG: TrmH family RNA methyltransferase [Bacilli bacterium]
MKKYKKTNNFSYSLGITLTFYLLENKPQYINKVYIHSKYERNETYYKLINLCEENDIEYLENDKVFNVLSDKENCYVIGEFLKYSGKLEKNSNHLVLINPSNMGNLGTIIRSMVGFGVFNLAIVTPAVDIFDPKVIRSSMGSLFKINFEFYDSFTSYQNEHNNNMYPFMLQTRTNLYKNDFVIPFSLIFGNEASGLDSSFLEVGTPLIIKHNNEIDSLNITNAVAIGLYEATKNDF